MGLLNLVRNASFNNGLYFTECPFCGGSLVLTDDEFVCFDCGKSGDAADYLSYKNGVSYTTAKWQLSKISYPLILEVINKAVEYYQKQLKVNHPYLIKRGLTPETINKFQIGWSDGNLKNYLTSKGYSEDLLYKAGLIKTDGRDVFYARIMFPIRNSLGQAIGFGGRKIKDASSAPKYLNSPETPVFSKRECLFGIDSIDYSKPVYLVEGYMDVISLQQAGINAVAALGTATGKRQAQLLKSLGVKNLILSLDGDEAGVKNAVKATNVFGSVFNTKVLNHYGSCKDPDEFIKKNGPDEFLKLNTISIPAFLARSGINPVEFL